MLAARLDAPGSGLRLVEVPEPTPSGTEVRIRVAACGVCHTDLHIVDGAQQRVDLPLVLGHEVAGWIDSVGSDAVALLSQLGLALGDPVVVHGGWGCGECRDCASGDEQRCLNSRAPGFQADGGYAAAMLIPHPRHLVALGRLGPVRAAPLADAGVTPYRAVRRAEPWLEAGARVLQVGCGGLGQFALQYLRLLPPAGRDLRVAVRELNPARLERASDLGADVSLLGGDAATALDALEGAADVVLDFVGTDETLALAASAVAPGGLVVLSGEAGGQVALGFDTLPTEAWLTTVAWGSLNELREVVSLAERGRLQWNVERMPLREVAQAHARLRAGDVDGRLVLLP